MVLLRLNIRECQRNVSLSFKIGHDKIDNLKDAITQYDETRELAEDLETEIQDKIYEWQDNNYEMLNYKLEFEIEINDSELELLEYYLERAEGNIYKTAEAMEAWFNTNFSENINSLKL